MIGKKLKSIVSSTAEFMASLGFVVIFFLLFLGVLSLSFPRGTTLNDLLRMHRLDPLAVADESLSLEMEGLDQDPAEPLIAMLAELRRKVQSKPADAIAWTPARRGMQLRERHAVQTFSHSHATIAFDWQSELELGQNSLLILRDITKRQVSGLVEADAIVVEGEFHGRFDKNGPAMQLNLATDSGRFEIRSDAEHTADFKVAVDPDRSSTLSVYEGAATAIVGGRTVVVEPDHSVTIDASGRLGAPVRLPPPPDSEYPADAATYAFRAAPPEVRFGWRADDRVDGYRFELARDPGFKEPVHLTETAQAEFTHGHLAAGTYYWRVSAFRDGGSGRAGATRTVQVLQDVNPPDLRVDFPEVAPTGANVIVRGSAGTDSRVFIRGAEVAVDVSGSFEHELSLEPGANLLVVEAVDPVGNIAYRSSVLHSRNQ